MKSFYLVVTLAILMSCDQKEQADLIVTNSNTYTVNDNFEKAEAFAVKDGKFVGVGSSTSILSEFESDIIVDAENQTIVPGFIDAHCHFLGLGINQQAADLVGTTSFDEVVQRVVDFQKTKNLSHIMGRGWDQNDWEVQKFPNKSKLDSLFPDTPVSLTRIDGHAILCNQAALDLGKVTADSKIDGGEVVLENGELTGVLVDNAENLVMNYWPTLTENDVVQALKEAEKICFDYGLTTVDDAGLTIEVVELIERLQRDKELKMRIYAMVSATEENMDHFLNKGLIKTDRLNVRSFKFYADGALGSRGAMLRAPYNDKPGHFGLMVNSIETLNSTAERIAKSEYQMNTHAIGDSANHAVLETYVRVLEGQKDRRWRVEHAQVISPEDFDSFGNIIPSIQPTHATSDMYWA
ncbi:MAG: amidohydrolase, partial [Bacteroidia bacterium]|nr:amidohydrolase [Bacteroidia bacterium]